MAQDIATLGIRVDSTETRQATNELNNLTQSAGRTQTQMSATERAAQSMGVQMSSLNSLVSAFGITLGAVGFARLATDIINTNRSMESLRAQLKAVTGSAAEAQKTFDFLTRFAVNTPFEIDGLTKAFLTLQNYGITPTAKVMDAVTNQAAKLGGSVANLEGITIALGQSWSKGKLQGQEILQLVNQGVPVYQLLAEATHKNTMELQGMAEKGLLTRDVIDKLINKMGEMASGSNAAAMETLNGKISNLADAWHQWEDALLGDKSEGIIKSIVSSITETLNILTKQMGATLDAQIAHAKSRIETFNSLGGVGSALADFTGYDINVEKNKLDSLMRQKSIQDETAALKSQADEAKKLKDISDTSAITKTKEVKARKEHKDALTDEQKSLNALNAEYKNRIDGLLRQIDLEGKNRKEQLTNEAEYDVEKGSLAKLTEQQKLYYLQETAILQNKQNQTKANQTQKDELAALVDQYNKLTLSARDYYSLTLTNKGIAPDQQGALLNQFDKNSQAEAQKKSIDDAKAAYDEYLKSIDSAIVKTTDLNAAVGSFSNTQISALNGIINVYERMHKSITDINKELAKNAEAKAYNEANKTMESYASNKIKLDKQELDLTGQKTKSELSGAAQIAGSVANLFDQKSKAAQMFHAIEMGLSIARLAMDAKEIASSLTKTAVKTGEGAASMFADLGPLGFAAVAAMLAVLASIGFKSGGSSSGVTPRADTSLGTVLGDKTVSSNSINSTNELLKSIHATEYVELRGINAGVNNLSKSILDTITNLFQGGGLSNVALTPATMTGISSIFSSIPVLGKLAGSIANFFFGGKQTQTLVAQGIAIDPTPLSNVLSGGNVSSYQYADVNTHTSGGLFGSDKDQLSTTHLSLDQKVQASVNLVFRAMGDTMMSVAKQLGGEIPNKLKDLVIPFTDIGLMGLNGTDAAKKFNGVISATLDNMATTVFGDIIGQYQQLGEGMLQTAIRIVSEMAVVKDSLSKSMLTLGDNAIAVSDQIIQAAGSISEFQRQFSAYYDKFYSESEKTQKLGESLTSQLADLGLSLADSRAAYRHQIELLDMSNALDVQRYSLLISLAESADAYYTSLENVAKAQQDVIKAQQDTATAAMKATQDAATAAADLVKTTTAAVDKAKQDLSNAYKAEQTIIQATISKVTQFVNSLKTLKDSLTLGALSTGTPLDKYNAAGKAFMDTVTTLQGGAGSTTASQAKYDAAMAAFNTNAQAFLEASRTYNASGGAYGSDYKMVMDAINLFSEQGAAQLTDAQKQYDILTKANDNLGIISQATVSMADGIKALNDAINKDLAAKSANTLASNNAFQAELQSFTKYSVGLLGRALSDYEMTWLNNQVTANIPIADIFNAINSYAALNGSHASGLDFVPFDGYRAELHKGERVLTAAQVRDGGTSQEVIAELRFLRAEVAKLREDNHKQTGDIIRSNYDANDQASDKIVVHNEKIAKKSDWVNKSRAVIA